MTTKTLSWLLFGSLTLNALLGGWIIARSARRHLAPPPALQAGPDSGPKLLTSLIAAAGGPKSPRFQEARKKHPLELGKLRREMIEAQGHVNAELRSREFSEGRFKDAVGRLEELEIRGLKSANEFAVHLASRLTPEERAQAAERKRPERGPRGR